MKKIIISLLILMTGCYTQKGLEYKKIKPENFIQGKLINIQDDNISIKHILTFERILCNCKEIFYFKYGGYIDLIIGDTYTIYYSNHKNKNKETKAILIHNK